jgi:hypothetical protein
MNLYFNPFHVRKNKMPALPCLAKTCRSTHVKIDTSSIIAVIEYRLRDDPAASMKLQCELCGYESTYDYRTVMQILPPDWHPPPLPDNASWAIILFELTTAASMPERAFFGERVLVCDVAQSGYQWSGQLISESLFAPSLERYVRVAGQIWNGHQVCTGYYREKQYRNLPIQDLKTGMVVGLYFMPKNGNSTALPCGNISCANPRCTNYCSITYRELDSILSNGLTPEMKLLGATHGYLVMKCEMCQTSRVADRHSFDHLVKM